jgi:hypothetical protein
MTTPCTNECTIMTSRQKELRTSAGAYREMLVEAVKKLTEHGIDPGIFTMFLNSRHDIGAAQARQMMLDREAAEAGRSAIWYLEHYVVQMRKELARKGLLDPADRDEYDELGSAHLEAMEKVATYRALDETVGLTHHRGDFSKEPLAGADPRAHGHAQKVATAARALLAMDAYIHRLRQAYYSNDPEVRSNADKLLNHVGSEALQDAWTAYALLGLNGEWCGSADRRPTIAVGKTLMERCKTLEEANDRLAVDNDDLKADNEKLRAELEKLRAKEAR